jgi:hypothetical protein
LRVSAESERLPPSNPNSSVRGSSGPGSSVPAGAPDRELSRRRALAKLGLAAAAVYVAPTIVHLDRSAKAVSPSCTGGKAKGNPWCNTNNG